MEERFEEVDAEFWIRVAPKKWTAFAVVCFVCKIFVFRCALRTWSREVKYSTSFTKCFGNKIDGRCSAFEKEEIERCHILFAESGMFLWERFFALVGDELRVKYASSLIAFVMIEWTRELEIWVLVFGNYFTRPEKTRLAKSARKSFVCSELREREDIQRKRTEQTRNRNLFNSGHRGGPNWLYTTKIEITFPEWITQSTFTQLAISKLKLLFHGRKTSKLFIFSVHEQFLQDIYSWRWTQT